MLEVEERVRQKVKIHTRILKSDEAFIAHVLDNSVSERKSKSKQMLARRKKSWMAQNWLH